MTSFHALCAATCVGLLGVFGTPAPSLAQAGAAPLCAQQADDTIRQDLFGFMPRRAFAPMAEYINENMEVPLLDAENFAASLSAFFAEAPDSCAFIGRLGININATVHKVCAREARCAYFVVTTVPGEERTTILNFWANDSLDAALASAGYVRDNLETGKTAK